MACKLRCRPFGCVYQRREETAALHECMIVSKNAATFFNGLFFGGDLYVSNTETLLLQRETTLSSTDKHWLPGALCHSQPDFLVPRSAKMNCSDLDMIKLLSTTGPRTTFMFRCVYKIEVHIPASKTSTAPCACSALVLSPHPHTS